MHLGGIYRYVVADIPETRYARSGDVSIAYQVVGDAPLDVVQITRTRGAAAACRAGCSARLS